MKICPVDFTVREMGCRVAAKIMRKVDETKVEQLIVSDENEFSPKQLTAT